MTGIGRTASVVALPDAACGTPGVIRLTGVDGRGRREADLYFFAEVACDVASGRQFELVGYRPAAVGEPDAVRRYNVLVTLTGAAAVADGSCDCGSGTFRGHRRLCKHVQALAALWRRGDL